MKKKNKFYETSGLYIIKDNIKPPWFTDIQNPKITGIPSFKIKKMMDFEGLTNAYASADNVYLNDNTMYVSGTKHADTLISTLPNFNPIQNYMKGYYQDMWDDLKIPFHNTANTQRYQEANEMLRDNPQITNVVGHSLGGSVALELEKNNPQDKLFTTTYGAPVYTDSSIYSNRFRVVGDPVSMFDNGALTKLPNSINPHSYENGFNQINNNDNDNKVSITE